MNFKERAKEELRKLKKLSFKEKLQYIWDYYKPVLAGIVVLLLIVKIGVDINQNNQIEKMLNVAVFNSIPMSEQSEVLVQEFEALKGYDGEKQVVNVDTNYQVGNNGNVQMEMASQVKMTVMIQSGDMDVILVPESAFESMAAIGFFADVREVLSEESQNAYKDGFTYGKTEEDTEEIPYGIRIDGSEKIKGMFAEEEICLAFGANIKKTAVAEDFLKYLLP